MDQVRHAFSHADIHRYLGVGLEKLGDDRSKESRDVRIGEDAQRAPWFRLQGARGMVGFVQIGKDPAASVVVGFANFRQADLARRAIEEPCTEVFFERLDMAADHRCRHVEAARRGGEATAIDDLGEDGQACQPVHSIVRSGRNIRSDRALVYLWSICWIVTMELSIKACIV